MLKHSILFACIALAFRCLNAQAVPEWQPSRGHTQLPIWPENAPEAQTASGPEYTQIVGEEPPGAIVVGKVSRPTMTVYSPTGKNTGAAVVVFPGGGYWVLYMDLEGTEVCDWLTSKGITCVLLKYRVPGKHLSPKSGPYPESPMALEDAQRTLSLVRHHAVEWHIDPHKIGVLGFSAGGHLAVAMSTHFEKRLYPAVDGADDESCRPDFAVAIYPGHLSYAAAKWDAEQAGGKFSLPAPGQLALADDQLGLNPDLHITIRTPPTFLLQAEDDNVDSVYDSLAYYIALQKAGIPVEMHLYAQGEHGFGLRPTDLPITRWPKLVETWLHTIGMISPVPGKQ